MTSTKIKHLLLSTSYAIFLIGCTSKSAKTLYIPKGWYIPQESTSYEVGVDEETTVKGKKVVTIKSIVNDVDTTELAALAQYCNVKQYRGKRVQLSGFMKSVDVMGVAGFWIRTDKKDSFRLQFIDNINEWGIKGTQSWKSYDIVIDIPEDVISMGFGAFLQGKGQIWFGNFSVDTVGADIPTTRKYSEMIPLEPSDNSTADTVDYRHINKAELEREYKVARYSSKDCFAAGANIPDSRPDIFNLDFEK
jgi:hypothetical protein